MATYKIELKKIALKEIEKLDRNILSLIYNKIESLAHNPHPVQSLKLSGSENSFRLRVGRYRILYQIENRTKTVTVFAIGHRKDIYRNM